MNGAALLANNFGVRRDAELFSLSDGRTLSYGETLANAQHLLASWKMKGVRKGDLIALVLSNHIAMPCCYLACMIGGLVAVPINPELGTDTVAEILALVRPRLVVDAPPEVEFGGPSGVDFGMEAAPDECGAIFFTSGTTGRPKGVRHRWSSLIGNVDAFNEAMEIGPNARMYHVLPMAYMAGFLNTILSPMVAGGSVVVGSRFSPASALTFWRQAKEQRANIVWLTPSIAAALVRVVRDRARAKESAVGFVDTLCGTAPLHPLLREQFNQAFGRPLQESYGTSELLLISAQTRASAGELVNDVGPALPPLELKCRKDTEGRDELLVRSPFALIDYLTEDGLVTIADSEGFVTTGDTAALLADGRIQITGRIKDIVIRGGINVAPRTIEDAIRNHADVVDVAIIGVPHEFWGEALLAYVEIGADTDAAAVEGAIRQLCSAHLPRSHQPDKIVAVPALPRAPTGKVLKHRLPKDLQA